MFPFRQTRSQTELGQCLFEVGLNVGWDQWRFAAPAHPNFE